LSIRLTEVKAQVEKAEDASQHKKLESYIQNAEETLASYNYAIQENQTEQELLRQHYEQDRERLVKLLNESPSSPRPDPSTVPAKQRAQLARQ
jgi:predicted  nucleic acid-binding Zn-ribbon protein